jgi:hypothetical protein
LQGLLQKVAILKERSNPKEMAVEMQRRCNELQTESDKLRKQLNKKEITLEAFTSEFIKVKQRYYEHEAARLKLLTTV